MAVRSGLPGCSESSLLNGVPTKPWACCHLSLLIPVNTSDVNGCVRTSPQVFLLPGHESDYADHCCNLKYQGLLAEGSEGGKTVVYSQQQLELHPRMIFHTKSIVVIIFSACM